ncbi:MAG: hypothetical protein IJ760_08530 [Bacteroidales bacterium]|nr:hypothetical protein [Bacteroidales bacterium]
MNKPLLILVAALAATMASCGHRPQCVELDNWQFKYGGKWYKATVPGFVHTDLMANGLLADPYLGTNEDSVRWVGDSVWHYTATVATSTLPKGDTLWVVFDGLAGNTVVEFNLHGKQSGTWSSAGRQLLCDNMFVQSCCPIDGGRVAKADSLRIDITLNDTLHFANDQRREADYGIALPDRRAFTRVAPYQQGWDWGPTLPTCGIWKRVFATNSREEWCGGRRSKGQEDAARVTLVQEDDSIGRSFTFCKDGEPFFAKGANWIPAHSFPVMDDVQKARYRLLLTSAKEAGFNMLRVWGGGIYEHDYFYDLCDSLGLMVWQDFNFSTMLYPDNPEMLASIEKEARQNVARIARHSCVVLWCGNNEVKNGWEDWGWQGVYSWTPEERRRLEKAMDTIFGYTGTTGNHSDNSILARAVRDCDPLRRPYITTSPLYGWGHPECTTHGDSHYWGVWWGELPFEVYKEKTGRFMSEYGFQSYPMIGSLRQFCAEDELRVDSPTLRVHQKHPRGLQIIDNAMMRYYGFDSKSLALDDYAYVSQLLQAWGAGYGIVCHLAVPRCAGTLYWQLNDCWPVASWSSIDYYGNWKALHHRAAELFSDSVDLGRWQRYYSVYPKDRHYDRAAYTIEQSKDSDGSVVVSLQAESDLYDVCLETEPHVDGHFTRNFTDLAAGQRLTATFRPADPKADVSGLRVKVRTLNDIYTSRR